MPIEMPISFHLFFGLSHLLGAMATVYLGRTSRDIQGLMGAVKAFAFTVATGLPLWAWIGMNW